jgi:tetratricopeptide (TPR) repeat protein
MSSSPKPWVFNPESQWSRRVRAEIGASPDIVAFLAPENIGVEFVIGASASRARPLVWVGFDDRDEGDEVSQGAKLAEAFDRSVGGGSIGFGLTLRAVVQRIMVTHALLGPYTLCLSGVRDTHLPFNELRELARLGTKVWLHFHCSPALGDVHIDGVHWLEADRFLVQPGEIAELVSDPTAAGKRVLTPVASVAPVPLLDLLRARLTDQEIDMVLLPRPGGAVLFGRNGDVVVEPHRFAEALMSRGRAIDAFEVLMRASAEFPDAVVNAAGREYSERGLFRRLWRVLSETPASVRASSDSLMRWFFAAATAENQHETIRDEVNRYLMANEAPELRALFAAAFPGPEFLEEAERALLSASTPTTHRVMAFAEILQGSAESAVDHLQRALRMSERLGDSSMVVASATDLSDYWSREGKYREAVSWSEWAVDWYWQSGCRDELRYAVARALARFNTMLHSDDVEAVEQQDDLDLGRVGIPTSEALLTTAAEVAFVRGDFSYAERVLRVALERSQLPQYPGVALDLVHVLKQVARHDECLSIARRAHTVSRQTSGVPRALGSLCMGIALLDRAPDEARIYLEKALEDLQRAHEAPRLAQCAIALGLACTFVGDTDGAKRALKRGKRGLVELGEVGWVLLGGHNPAVQGLRDLFHNEVRELELVFLGDRVVLKNGARQEIGLRQCEVLVALALSPEGVSADQLGLRVYGENALLPTIKAIVSRLRQSIDVSSRPYRIKGGVGADFLDLEHLVAAGRLREAVGLYRGPLLPGSDAPVVAEAREHLEELLRTAVLDAGDVNCMLKLSDALGDDAGLLDAVLDRLPPLDPRTSVVRAKRVKIEREWKRE